MFPGPNDWSVCACSGRSLGITRDCSHQNKQDDDCFLHGVAPLELFWSCDHSGAMAREMGFDGIGVMTIPVLARASIFRRFLLYEGHRFVSIRESSMSSGRESRRRPDVARLQYRIQRAIKCHFLIKVSALSGAGIDSPDKSASIIFFFTSKK